MFWEMTGPTLSLDRFHSKPWCLVHPMSLFPRYMHQHGVHYAFSRRLFCHQGWKVISNFIWEDDIPTLLITLLLTLLRPLKTLLTMSNCRDGFSGRTTTSNVAGDQTFYSVITNLSLVIANCLSCCFRGSGNLLFICCRQMYISWRDFVAQGRPLLTRSLVLFVALYLSRRHWMVRTLLYLNAGATDWGRCTALYPPIACSRLNHGNRLWCNSGTDNQWILCVLSKQSSVAYGQAFHVFHCVILARSKSLSRLSTFKGNISRLWSASRYCTRSDNVLMPYKWPSRLCQLVCPFICRRLPTI